MPITVDEHMKNIRAIRAQKREAHKRYVEALEAVYFHELLGGSDSEKNAKMDAVRSIRAEIGGKK